MRNAAERLSKQVGRILSRWNIGDVQIAFLDTVLYVVVANIDMFPTSVPLCIQSKRESR